jgi:hypothetical protein
MLHKITEKNKTSGKAKDEERKESQSGSCKGFFLFKGEPPHLKATVGEQKQGHNPPEQPPLALHYIAPSEPAIRVEGLQPSLFGKGG